MAATTDAGFLRNQKPMSTKNIEAQEGIDVTTTGQLITGPWTEPIEQGGENYYRCSDCDRESLRRGDLEHPEFHAVECVGSERL